MNEIKMISIEQLHPHPDNPRKNIGDVTELADSIRHSGVMQNLTVVPCAGAYRVIIGHRRLAAAKEAGLTELPCRVVEMSESEQLSTMIAENMQRADLTVPEQVHGIQLLLDLGETPEKVMKSTGLSRTTFYHRKNMAALPADELQKSWERGGTMAEYVALEGIKDQKKREQLLKHIGTRNFDYMLQEAKEEQAYIENRQDVLLMLEPVAKKLAKDRDESSWEYISFTMGDWKQRMRKAIGKIEQDKDTDYYFYIGDKDKYWARNNIYIYRGKEQKKKTDSVAARKEKERVARISALHEEHRRCTQLQMAWVQELKIEEGAMQRIAAEWLRGGYYVGEWERENFLKMTLSVNGTIEDLKQTFNVCAETMGGRLMLLYMIWKVPVMYGYYGEFCKRNAADAVRRLLGDIGYSESDEEQAYWTGTNELFYKEEQNNV